MTCSFPCPLVAAYKKLDFGKYLVFVFMKTNRIMNASVFSIPLQYFLITFFLDVQK